MKPKREHAILLLVALIVLDTIIWYKIFLLVPNDENSEAHFLDVGQGDSVLIKFGSGATMLYDAGRDRKVTDAISNALPNIKRIDIAVISHADEDHFGGFNEIIKRYEIGAFILNGRISNEEKWEFTKSSIEALGIPIIVAVGSDAIHFGKEKFSVLSPDRLLLSGAEDNDSSIVGKIYLDGFTILLTGDISSSIEEYIADKHELRADVLKVSHHGSKNSSSEFFLSKVNPKIAVIQAGANNKYGHPSPETISKLIEKGVKIFRTDIDGTIELKEREGLLTVFCQC